MTEAGHAFARYAIDALAQWDALRSELRGGATEPSGALSIFATVTACYSFLPDALARFRAEHPSIQIRLRTGNAEQALEQLDDDAVDVSVAPLPDPLPARFESHRIVKTPILFVAPNTVGEVGEQLRRRPIPWSEVPMVLPEFGLARRHVDRWFRTKRVRPWVQNEVSGNEAILSLVALGCGVGVVPKLVLDNSPLRSRVRVLDVRPPLPPFRIAFCALARKIEAPVLAAFWRSVCD